LPAPVRPHVTRPPRPRSDGLAIARLTPPRPRSPRPRSARRARASPRLAALAPASPSPICPLGSCSLRAAHHLPFCNSVD